MAPEQGAPPTNRGPKRPISVARLEVVIARAVAPFGLLFGALAFPVALGQREEFVFGWWVASVAGFYGLLVVSAVAATVRRGTVPANASIAIVFMLALILWVPGTVNGGWTAPERPWVWFLITVASAAAAVAFPVWLATVYLLVAPTLYGLLRISQFGGSADPVVTALDVIYAVLLGGAVLVIITMLRAAAASVGTAQATALSRYLDAVGEHAREAERVQVDALVHDAVLSTFLTAGRAQSDEQRTLATTLARNAIRNLRSADVAAPEVDTGVSAASVVERIVAVAARMPVEFRFDLRGASETVLPSPVGEAVVAAALQAMVNSIRHAGDRGVERWVTVRLRADDGIHLEIGDTGVGFVFDEVPAERMGVRVSMIERMLLVGGETRVETAPGEGTLVFIDWPVERPVDAGRVAP